MESDFKEFNQIQEHDWTQDKNKLKLGMKNYIAEWVD